MKSTHFACRKRYHFAKLVQEADYGRHPWDLFPIWSRCASISLR